MKRNIDIKLYSIDILSSIQHAKDLFDKDFKTLESYNSGLDYDKWSDEFYDGMVEATESVKKVLAEIIEQEVNKAVGEP